MTPSATTGVVWLLTPSMTPCRNSQRGLSDLTFDVLISFRAENRLPARSKLWSGQSTDVTASRRCASTRGERSVEASTANTAITLKTAPAPTLLHGRAFNVDITPGLTMNVPLVHSRARHATVWHHRRRSIAPS